MLKGTSCIILVITLFILNVGVLRAEEYANSGAIKSAVGVVEYDYRVENLKGYLSQFDSPLAAYSKELVQYADENGLDYRLIPAISGVESTFGKKIPPRSYNAYGWANGDYSFTSWTNSIEVVSTTLRIKYVEKGATSINKIARIYAPPSSTWAGKVKYFVSKIDTLPLNFDII